MKEEVGMRTEARTPGRLRQHLDGAAAALLVFGAIILAYAVGGPALLWLADYVSSADASPVRAIVVSLGTAAVLMVPLRLCRIL